MTESKLSKLVEIQYLRGFSILAVLVIHVSTHSYGVSNLNLVVIINIISHLLASFAVPLFIFVSGFVLSLKYIPPFNKNIFYSKRMQSILPPYLIFSSIYMVLGVVISYFEGVIKIPSFLDILYNITTASSHGNLWFIALIAQFYLFYPQIINLYYICVRSGKVIFLFCILIGLKYLWLFFELISSNSVNSTFQYLIGIVFIPKTFYFILGIHVSNNYGAVKKQLIESKGILYIFFTIFIVFFISILTLLLIHFGKYSNIPVYYKILISMSYLLYHPLVFFVLLVSCLSLSSTNSILSRLISWFGTNSFGIYLIHGIYIDIFVNLLFPKLHIYANQWSFYILFFISVTCLSYYSILFIEHLPYNILITGKRG